MDQLDNLIIETTKNISAATEHASNISSHSSQLKLHFSKTQQLYSRETSSALKKTAEHLLDLITSNANDNVDKQTTATPFLEFKSEAEKRLAYIDGMLTTVGCIVGNE